MHPPPPMALLSELTHRCPLKCAYCSNPLELVRASAELETGTWMRILEEAAELGVLQVHFSGGEPMARRDLPELVRHAAGLQLYTNVITSGVLLTDSALAALVDAGVDHIQLSFQDSNPASAEAIGGLAGAHALKLDAARRITAAGMPLTTNFVIHRRNADRVGEMIALAEALGAARVEIAHTQYYGWGLLNRAGLMPTRAQVDCATACVEAARARLKGTLTIDYVAPDYFATRPKACMGGWGTRFVNVSPSGKVLPCHAAETIPNLRFPSVREQSLDWIWSHSDAFRRFRGTEWMPMHCRSCERREIDWGGCRCQALALTGDAAAADPVCANSPHHGVVKRFAGQDGMDMTLIGRAWLLRDV
ncbi:pyrroloquinoline quinone biosynthesis protein PqqE [Burkholderia anthina]|uniref:pyrroloquinoline quinone biosynthesis protein PqqE n=1 Tax=Burkholderia anthina TaxID=179879 RepID=UPI001ABB8AF6|nr:pyrroloquinoline quinone biosynthesis protein PqqE [Burkholderia anthina]